MKSLFIFLFFSASVFGQDAKAVKQNDTSYEYKSIEINSMAVVISSRARLSVDLENGGKRMVKLSKGDSVYIYNYYPSLFVCSVSFNENSGFIDESQIKSIKIDEYYNQRDKEIELKKLNELNERRLKEEEKQKERKTKFVKKYGKKWGTLVAEKKIQIGMTDEMALDSWGKPVDINRTVGKWGVHEQWVYKIGNYLYFENGKLTSWQD